MSLGIIKLQISARLQSFHLLWVACLSYVFMEWLFFVTKPSILSYYTLPEKISVIFLGSLILFLCVLPIAIVLNFIDWCLKKFLTASYPVYFLFMFIPAALFGLVIFLLVENFSYTVFGFNSISTVGVGRFVYALLLVALVTYIFYKIYIKNEPALESKRASISKSEFASLALMVVGLGFALAGILSREAVGEIEGNSSLEQLPNIIIFSSDGISSNNMSAYGYERDTTPFINSLVDESLISENHFSNAANTTGSVISLLTGKSPITTRVIYPPDTLSANDSYQHLPGILKKLGYHNGDISLRFYADTADLNMLGAFDYINGRNYEGDKNLANNFFDIVQTYFPADSLFLRQIFERISSRLFYISGLRDIQNPFQLVTEAEQLGPNIDADRFTEINQFIDSPSQPFFLHAHLMGSHGPRFRPKNTVFSADQDQSSDFITDYYDDAIRDFDDYVDQLVTRLKQTDQYENSLIIINTDHGMNSQVDVRLPLLIKFPRGEHSGRVVENTQRIDIAPTILDYLGMEQPSWMEGRSIFTLGGSRQREIYASSTVQAEVNDSGDFEVTNPSEPFYTLGKVYLINCQSVFLLDLLDQNLSSRILPKHSSPCETEKLLSEWEARTAILKQLAEKGYDVSGLVAVSENWLEYFSGPSTLLEEGKIYLPTVSSLELEYSAILMERQSGIFELLQTGRPRAADSQNIYDVENALLSLPVINIDGIESSLELIQISEDPIAFQIIE